MTAVMTAVEVVEATVTAMMTVVAMAAATTTEDHAPTATDPVATTAMAASDVEVATAAVATIALLVVHHLRLLRPTATLQRHLPAAATKTVVATTRQTNGQGLTQASDANDTDITVNTSGRST